MQTFSVIEQFDISEYIRLHLFYCIIFLPVCQFLLRLAKKLSIQLLSYGHPGALMDPVISFSFSMLDFFLPLHFPRLASSAPGGNPQRSQVRVGEPLWRRKTRQQSPLKTDPFAVPEKICASLSRLCLIFFDRCTFLASLHPPQAGTPNALKFASGNPFGGARLVNPRSVFLTLLQVPFMNGYHRYNGTCS